VPLVNAADTWCRRRRRRARWDRAGSGARPAHGEREGLERERGGDGLGRVIVTLQVPVPVQPPPLQPVKVEPAAGVAVRVTAVPVVNAAEHVVPQEIPAGLLVTVPLPVPDRETVSVEVVETPVPLTTRESVSPSAVKLMLVLASAVVVGVKRTVTVAVAPVPTRVKGLPETMVKGAGAEARP